ncbi:ku80-like protein [Paxillus ammoniavirescens]|nr:ku80-like protein [Paxillus ammoniavirescens]
MPAERAGYTVTMFLVDVSPSMGATRSVTLPDGPNGEARSIEMTKLEWSLQFVKMKIQEMIFNGRKTDQCGVVIFGSEETDNIINGKNGGYDHVAEYIRIGQPNAGTLAKLDELRASGTAGDPIDALIVGIETQDVYLEKKRTWTRKIVIITDGENPMEIEDWEATVKKMASLNISLTVVGVDFDDDELPYHEEDKSTMKRTNETFYARLTSSLPDGLGLFGTLERALLSLSYPHIKETKSALLATTLRLGDVETRENEAIELGVKIAKCTSLARAGGWKKFVEVEDMEDVEPVGKVTFTEVKRRTEYFIDTSSEVDAEGKGTAAQDVEMDIDEEEGSKGDGTHLEKVEKEQLVRGFKYGSTYVPCPDGQFEKLQTKKGIDICGFFQTKNLNRSYPMSEVWYVYASPTSVPDQLAFSSIVQAMYEKGVLAIARMVTRDGADPKMGVLSPVVWPGVDVLLWVQMPFADDVRHYTFPSLSTLTSRSGERITKHAYLPTEEQLEAMDKFVDAMDLTDAGEEEEDGSCSPWFDPRLSYNPSIHRTKQAQFHSAVVPDLASHPLPPPHYELTKYFNCPRRVLKASRDALEECKGIFNVKEVPKKALRARKDDHIHARDEDEDMILLDQKGPPRKRPATVVPRSTSQALDSASQVRAGKKKAPTSDSETEPESEEELLLEAKPKRSAEPGLPTPTASPEPEPDPQRAPGRIIGNAFPLKDFRQNLRQGDVVTKAVEDLGVVVREIVGRPFGSRRKNEMLECLESLREVCLREDEIDAWNAILKKLKEDCMAENGNREFWTELQKLGRKISLISSLEAQKLGGMSDVSEAAAAVFMQQ